MGGEEETRSGKIGMNGEKIMKKFRKNTPTFVRSILSLVLEQWWLRTTGTDEGKNRKINGKKSEFYDNRKSDLFSYWKRDGLGRKYWYERKKNLENYWKNVRNFMTIENLICFWTSDDLGSDIMNFGTNERKNRENFQEKICRLLWLSIIG